MSRQHRGKREEDARYERLAPLFEELARADLEEEHRIRVRAELVEGHLPLARHITAKFRNRGQSEEDLMQVATIGLVNAVDRFDPVRGTSFLGFAVPTIMGEIRRYFRDCGWSVHMPRRLQELHMQVEKSSFDLSQRLGRPPTPREIAADLDLTVDDVHEALEAGNAYQSLSLDRPASPDPDAPPAVELLGDEDGALDGVVNREALKPLLARLSERDRRILFLRFFREMSQSQIAAQIGVSQMQVSRLLSSLLHELRTGLAEESSPKA